MEERDPAVATRLAEVAREHGLSAGAVGTLWDALLRGGGRMAQFSHPDLGGMGQWSGGMVQIGDMFNAALRASVAAACADLALLAVAALADRRAPDARGAPVPRTSVPPTGAPRSVAAMAWPADDWWPGGLGHPAASGAQDGLRYAYFAERRRLAVERDGRVTLYDTGHHRIVGASQRQVGGSHLAFTAEDGTVDLGSLPVVEA